MAYDGQLEWLGCGVFGRHSNQAAEGMDMNEAEFRQELQEQGYGEAQLLEFEPNSAADMHTHEFSAYAFVLSGEFIFVTEDGAATHLPGQTCKLAAGTLHSEQTGASGATILVGKK